MDRILGKCFVLFILSLMLSATAVLAPALRNPPSSPDRQPEGILSGEVAGCSVFPDDNIWNVRVDTAPLDPNSETFVNTIGASLPLHPDFGASFEGSPIGIPFVAVPGTQERVAVSFTYEDESDPGPYPIPPDAPIEGGPDSDGDRHVLVVDQDNCLLYELWNAWPQPDGSWQAGSGAVFDLGSNDLRPDGWTSADAAGLPILAGLITYDEVASGEIRHAIRFTAPQTRRAYVWPARHFASSLTGLAYPPMGQRFRLKSDYDISGFDPEVQVILEALKRYGMILADNGSAWYITGCPDERWNNEILHQLTQVPGNAFEAVDVSSLMIDPDSGQARVSACKNDFDRDGQEDILWRYQGAGDYQGWNVVWLMGQTEEGPGLAPQSASRPQKTLLRTSSAAKAGAFTQVAPGIKSPGSSRQTGSLRTPLGGGAARAGRPKKTMLDPFDRGNPRSARGKAGFQEQAYVSPLGFRGMETVSLAAPGTVEIAALETRDYLYLQPITDLAWEIVGTGDFDGDGDTDILWRNYGAGDFSGWNVIWYMNGEMITGYGYLYGITDLDWRIVGTGDFNRDGRMDILWRNYGGGTFSGWNVIWYMNGEAIEGYGYLYGITDLDWKIVGTGDFDQDGQLDILWRNYGSPSLPFSGWNVVWYMDGEGIRDYGYLTGITDLSWEIAGTGDFNSDGYVDILWRNYGTGTFGGWNCIWYMEGESITGFDYPTIILDTNWRIVNR